MMTLDEIKMALECISADSAPLEKELEDHSKFFNLIAPVGISFVIAALALHPHPLVLAELAACFGLFGQALKMKRSLDCVLISKQLALREDLVFRITKPLFPDPFRYHETRMCLQRRHNGGRIARNTLLYTIGYIAMAIFLAVRIFLRFTHQWQLETLDLIPILITAAVVLWIPAYTSIRDSRKIARLQTEPLQTTLSETLIAQERGLKMNRQGISHAA